VRLRESQFIAPRASVKEERARRNPRAASAIRTPPAAYQQAEIKKWWPIIKAAGIKLDE
jgi:hypothetical protein